MTGFHDERFGTDSACLQLSFPEFMHFSLDTSKTLPQFPNFGQIRLPEFILREDEKRPDMSRIQGLETKEHHVSGSCLRQYEDES